MRLKKRLVRTAYLGAGLCLSALPVASARAQAAFTYNNGYNQTIDPSTGVVSGGTQYTYSDQVSPAYTSPYINYGAVLNEGISRIYSSFTVAQNTTVTLNTLSLDLYVTDANGSAFTPATQDPFSAAHIAVYNTDPNEFGDISTAGGQAVEQSALVGGDDTFTQNALEANGTTFTNNYIYSSASGGSGAGDMTRPVYSVGVNLGGVTLGEGTYFFVVSVGVNQTIAPGADAYSVLADPTDDTFGQPSFTNGQNGIYDPNGDGAGQGVYETDQPEYNGPGSPLLLDAFPYTLTGSVGVIPEPGSFALLGIAGLPILGAVRLRNRRRTSGAKQTG